MTLQQRIRRDQSRHNDDWLITYADTITLLLCLFVITLAIKTGAKLATPEATAPATQTTAQDGVFWGQPALRSFTPITEAAADAPSLMMIGPAVDAPAARNEADIPASATLANPYPEAPRQLGTTPEPAAAPMIVPARPQTGAAQRREATHVRTATAR